MRLLPQHKPSNTNESVPSTAEAAPCSPSSSSSVENERNVTNLLIRSKSGPTIEKAPQCTDVAARLNGGGPNGGALVPFNAIDDDDGGRNIPQAWKLCPMPNYYALMAAAGVVFYTGVFLLYAQDHSLVLLIMTSSNPDFSLIGVCIVCLYTSGVLCVLYMMLRIKEIEGGSSMYDGPKPSIASLSSTYDCSNLREDGSTAHLMCLQIRPSNQRIHTSPSSNRHAAPHQLPRHSLPNTQSDRPTPSNGSEKKIVIFNVSDSLSHERRPDSSVQFRDASITMEMKF